MDTNHEEHNLSRKFTLATLPVLLLALASWAAAGTVNVTFVGTGSNTANLPGIGGVYTYPYYLSVNGNTATVLCDDVNDEVFANEHWQANATNLGADIATNDFTGTMFQNQAKYEEAAWLMSQLNASNNNDIQVAIWSLFDTNSAQALSLAGFGQAQTWLTDASNWVDNSANLTGFAFDDFVIYNPIPGTQFIPGSTQQLGLPQEYITETPEPVGLVLLGTGLLLLVGLTRKRFGRTA